VVVEHIDLSGLLFWKVATAVVVLVHMKLVQVLPQRRVWQEDMKTVAAASFRLFPWSNLLELRGRWGHRHVSKLGASLRLFLLFRTGVVIDCVVTDYV
jgi:hypothetical protein